MNEEKPNPAGTNNVKLVFDVMPFETDQKISETIAEQVQKNESTKPIPVPADPSGTEIIHPVNSFRRFFYLLVGAILLSAAIAGIYFAIRRSAPSPDDFSASSSTLIEAAMPESWMRTFFGTSQCGDPSLCEAGADPDNDFLKNVDEAKYGTSPLKFDSDFDGIADADEINVFYTDPMLPDTDGDTYQDGTEIRNGYSPIIGGPDKISPIELRQIEDNKQSFGLHESTRLFLDMKLTRSTFSLATATPQSTFSIPNDYIFRQNSSSEISYSHPVYPETGFRFFLLTAPDGLVNDEDIFQKVISDSIKIGNSINPEVREERTISGKKYYFRSFKDIGNPPSQKRVMTIYTIQSSNILIAEFICDEQNYSELSLVSSVVLNSFR